MKYLPLLLILSCSSTPKEGDRRIKADAAPAFLQKYRTQKLDDLEFYEKVKDGVVVYEVKYEIEKDDEDQEISIKYSDKGEFLEREEDVDFDRLEKKIRSKIRRSIGKDYPGAKIHETEYRTDRDQKKYIDVEIRHSSSPSGYWELSFDEEGNYVSRKMEHYDHIETLN